jgi:precorrin-6B methylase 2
MNDLPVFNFIHHRPQMFLSKFKVFLPDRPIPLRVLRGPFRGSHPVMNPRHSLRKVAGLYERELNHWIEEAIRRTNTVIDVGANDGYFCFGCAAAFRRLRKNGQIVAIEAQEQHIRKLESSLSTESNPDVPIDLIHAFAGATDGNGFVTLDGLDESISRNNTLIKIDVEGAEIDVLDGARRWMNPSNLFVIEVHQEEFLSAISERFAAAGMPVVQINQQPHPLLGRERRDLENWWLVSDLQIAST